MMEKDITTVIPTLMKLTSGLVVPTKPNQQENADSAGTPL